MVFINFKQKMLSLLKCDEKVGLGKIKF